MQKTFCIVCGKERNGIEVENDIVLDAIRWFKRNVTKNERNNRLVVCKDDYAAYAASRRKFESRQRLYIFIGVLFVITSMIVSPRLSTLLVSILIFVLLAALALLSYMPRINIKKPHKQ